MAGVKRSLMNEHMITVLNKVSCMSEPVQKSYLYYSQAEKESVDYMISIDLIKEVPFTDESGVQKKGYVLGDFGRVVYDEIIDIQKKISLQEHLSSLDPEDPSVSELKNMRVEYCEAMDNGLESEALEIRERMNKKENELYSGYEVATDRQVEELDARSSRKMATIMKWKQQKKNQ